MNDLIEALQIFLKYGNDEFPTHCEHDVFMVCMGLREDSLGEEDAARVKELGFSWNEEYDCWASTRFGSC